MINTILRGGADFLLYLANYIQPDYGWAEVEKGRYFEDLNTDELFLVMKVENGVVTYEHQNGPAVTKKTSLRNFVQSFVPCDRMFKVPKS